MTEAMKESCCMLGMCEEEGSIKFYQPESEPDCKKEEAL
jgi:hypothetical protein